MLIKVREHLLEIITTPINEKEINVTKITFDFPSSMDGFVKEAYFTLKGNTYKVIINDNKCDIPSEVLTEKGTIELGVVAYKVENESIIRYNPSPVYFTTWVGSLKEANNTQPITPSEMEQFEQYLQEGLDNIDGAIESASNLDINGVKVGNKATITITKQDQSQQVIEILDGLKGDKGDKGDKGNTGEQGIQGIQGPKGDKGNTGDTGPQGIKGDKGDKGDTGAQGERGPAGQNGTNGVDGFSPIANVTKTGKVATITITDKTGTTTATISDGEGGSGGSATDVQINGVSITSNDIANIQTKGTYNASTNKIATESDLPPKMKVLSYGSSTWNDFITAYNDNAIVYCKASSNSDPSTGTQGRMGFMAYVSNPSSPTSVEFQYYRSVSSHSASQQTDQVFVYTLSSNGTWSVTTREAGSKIATGTGLTSSYNNGTLTLSSTIDISGKLDSSKVKSSYSTTSGDVYDATYINSVIGDIESILSEV